MLKSESNIFKKLLYIFWYGHKEINILVILPTTHNCELPFRSGQALTTG
jgi:hypothetical protein